jgi:hypothetical protein
MMPAKNLIGMVVTNTLRSPRHFVLSVFGIVIGICAFVLFLSLTQQAGDVLANVFPLDEIKVVAPRVQTLISDTTKRLDDSTVQMIRARPEIKAAVPRMALGFPAAGVGRFEGTDLKFEVGGFADGVAASYVQDDARIRELFRDWDSPENASKDPNRVACVPPPPDPKGEVLQSPRRKPDAPKASAGADWGPQVDGSSTPAPAPAPAPDAGSGSADTGSGSATGAPAATPEAVEYYNPCPNPDRYYCDDTERICKHRVPIVLSATVVELYNNQFAKTHSMPVADKELVNYLIQARGLSAMRFSIGLGSTTLAGSSKVTRAKPRRIEAVVVGVSARAMPIGVTLPIDYIQRWNREYLGEDAAGAYSSIIATLKDPELLVDFTAWLEGKPTPDLRVEDSVGKDFATVIWVIRLLFLIISIAILVIAVINIGHNFFIQVSERRREIGIMRAVGASELDVRLLMLGEAAVIGIVGGLLGIGLAVGIGTTWDWFSRDGIPAFPFKPHSWFDFKTWIWGGGLVFSTTFCILGGFLPARKAAKMEPAQALTQN